MCHILHLMSKMISFVCKWVLCHVGVSFGWCAVIYLYMETFASLSCIYTVTNVIFLFLIAFEIVASCHLRCSAVFVSLAKWHSKEVKS